MVRITFHDHPQTEGKKPGIETQKDPFFNEWTIPASESNQDECKN